MSVPTKQQLNGRALYLLIDPRGRQALRDAVEVHQSPDGLEDYAREHGLVLVQGFIAYDGREAGEE